MQKPSIPEIYKSPTMIQEIIDDLRLQEQQAELHFAIDPSEVVDFCFPINPREFGKTDLAEIADNQVALYEVLFARTSPPILLSTYAEEMERYGSFLSNTVAVYYDKAEILAEFARNLDLREYRGVTKEKLLDFVGEDFNILLAVAMGIYSFGADRFRAVGNRLVLLPSLGKVFQQLCTSYKETQLADRIYRDLQEELERLEEAGRIDQIEKRRRSRTARVDARAVDTLIYLNNSLEEAFKTGRIDRRHVLLYLSSAPRTARIFEFLKRQMPRVLEGRYPFWRTKAQVFAYVAHRATANGTENPTDTIRNLEIFKEAAHEIKRLEAAHYMPENCSGCVLEGGQGNLCSWKKLCETVRQLGHSIHLRSATIQNLGLVAGIRTYEAFLRATPSKGEELFLERFRGIYNTVRVDLALEKMQALQAFSLAQAKSTSMLLGSLHGEGEVVTSIGQKLPVNPGIKSPEYKKIIALVVEYYKAPLSKINARGDLILEACRLFFALDLALQNPVAEHELVRCFLYLAFPNDEARERALDHALKSRVAFKELTLEFNYLMIWAARLLKRFKEADRVIRESLDAFPQDPRIYHGHTLVIFAWLSDPDQKHECPYGLNDAVAAASRAIELYRKDGGDFVDAIGACLNDLAYLFAYDKTSAVFDLSKARLALTELKQYVSKDKWSSCYPEYFHTEANLEYHEFMKGFHEGHARKPLKMKLTNARKDIEMAITLYPKKLYETLKNDIDKALNLLDSSKH